LRCARNGCTTTGTAGQRDRPRVAGWAILLVFSQELLARVTAGRREVASLRRAGPRARNLRTAGATSTRRRGGDPHCRYGTEGDSKCEPRKLCSHRLPFRLFRGTGGAPAPEASVSYVRRKLPARH